MPQQKAEEKQNQEIRQQLETLLLSNPKLKTDLNLNEQRFYYKALNPHLTKAQIDSKSSEEMLVFLGNKIKDSKTTETNFQNPNSQSLEEELPKTNLSSETHEQKQPIYIFPPNTDYPEDDFHEFYYPSDFPKHSHLQIVCSYFRLGPPYGLLTASLEHYEHQKNYLDQRPLENNLKNDPVFMSLLTRYGDYYLDYDLQDPDNKASKQYLFINPRTKRISKRRSAANQGRRQKQN